MKTTEVVVVVCFIAPIVTALNNRPIIGVLAQELSDSESSQFPGNPSSYIPASYVKYLEGAGARVVPIKINQSDAYYEELANSLNGILLPGGAAPLSAPHGYANSGWKFYQYAIKKNQEGDYFPIWGTCLGLELLSYLAAQRVNILTLCDSYDAAMPLEFKPGFNSSKLFLEAPENIVNILANQNVTLNNHHKCLTETNLTTKGLDRDWQVLSINKDTNGLEFVSSFEHKRYPIYGVQFHPEKNVYEWIANTHIPHTDNAILVEQYFADFFVNEARKSNHQFSSKEQEEAELIYNYQPTYTGKDGVMFQQCYFFSD